MEPNVHCPRKKCVYLKHLLDLTLSFYWAALHCTVYNKVKYVSYTSPTGATFLFLASLFIAATAVICIIIFIKRRMWLIRASSFLFLSFIGIGCTLGYSAIFSFIGKPDAATCMLRVFIPNYAFVIVYGSLLLKNWRYTLHLFRILVHLINS